MAKVCEEGADEDVESPKRAASKSPKISVSLGSIRLKR